MADAEDCCVGESFMGDPNGLHTFDCPVYERNIAALSDLQRQPEMSFAQPRPPMAEAAITEVIQGILDDYLGDSEPATRHREISEALTESWLKDRRRAVAQAIGITGSNPTGGGS